MHHLAGDCSPRHWASSAYCRCSAEALEDAHGSWPGKKEVAAAAVVAEIQFLEEALLEK